MTRDICSLNEWNQIEIEKRQKQYVEILYNNFHIS
jgi:hypothetical protein